METIRIQINGESHSFQTPITLKEILDSLQLSAPHVAVVLNSQVIPHKILSEKEAQAGDSIDLIWAVAGG